MKRTPRQSLRLLLLRALARIAPAPVAEREGASTGSLSESRILVMRPDHLGDMIFTTPALHVLRQHYPRASISALVGPWGAPVLRNNPDVDNVKTLAFPGFARKPKPSLWQPYRLLWGSAGRLRDQYDVALILRFDHWWGALLSFLARIPVRVGYDLSEVAPFLSHRLPYVAGQHEVIQNLQLAQWETVLSGGPTLNAQAPTPHFFPLSYHVPARAQVWVSQTQSQNGTIIIHPGAGAPVKLWKHDGWAQVADRLAHETGAPILLTGSEAERTLCQEIATQMRSGARVLAGETDLDQLAALFGQARLVLGVDSGPLHLAVATGTPSVHLFGPVDQATFGPWGPQEKHRTLVSAWPCIPCNRLDYASEELAHHPCVREISVDEVLEEAGRALAAG
jgi:lipopolysaccharide heptosyltransferase II